MKNRIEYREFISDHDNRKFTLPYLICPQVELDIAQKEMTLTDESYLLLQDYYKDLSQSSLNSDGIGIIFGTFDHLHAGHKAMLNAAKSLCSELYVGIEDQTIALQRKNHKHDIQTNSQRKQQLIEERITQADHIFIRTNALFDIKRYLLKGTHISTLFVGETQKDNKEIVDAIEYCRSIGVNVVAITRLKTKDKSQEISSTMLHQINSKGLGK